MSASEAVNSTPNLEEFDPNIIPYQMEVIDYVRQFDYRKGVLEVLLSGSFGSAKSLLMAHIGVTHLVLNPKARICLCRKALPDLKETIYRKIKDHMSGVLIEGEHYESADQQGRLEMWNGSGLISRSWHDKNYKKFRSIELSGAIVEEVTENSSKEFREFYGELFPRVGRLPGVKENFIISATNPDSPSHSAYEHFIANKHPTRRVFYSRTDENPFLPKTYIENIKTSMTAQEIRRYIYGEWVEIKADVIYYAYDREKSCVLSNYKVDERYPIHWAWDFNIGLGKPMSCVFFQHVEGKFFCFDEIVIESSRTLDICEEANARGLLDYRTIIKVQGDATGRRRDTRSIHSDYEIISRYLANMRNKHGDVRFEMDVGQANPPVRTRHTVVNGKLKNSFGEVSIFLDKDKCKVLDKGLRLTKLKKGGAYIEDDSEPWQHITTSLGYGICRTIESTENRTFFKKGRVG